MTSLVTHKLTMATGILIAVANAVIPVGTHFRNKPVAGWFPKAVLPLYTYYIEYATGIPALDILLSYLDEQVDRGAYFASDNHRLVGTVAKHCIASHGWGPSTSDAITVAWMAVIGMAKFEQEYGRQPSARMQFYNKAIEEGFYYDCETWKEFL